MRTVLIISGPDDETARMVGERLTAHPVRVISFDIADFPLSMTFAAFPGAAGPLGVVHTTAGTVDLDDVVGVLYRRPGQFRLPDDMLDQHRVFARVEARHGFGGVLTSVRAKWINHPSAIADGNFKPRQLRAAAAVGMNVPRTIITNSPESARKFANDIAGPVIYKVFEPPILPHQRVIFTSVVNSSDLDDPAIGLTAHLFQEQVPKDFDVRVTMIGHTCFAVAIRADSPAARIDFRSDYGSVSYSVVNLPAELPGQLRAYLDTFDLTFGAFDFAVTADGGYYFLECNPNGQWGWLQDETGLPMAEAFAECLAGD